jgi:two-component sensor histidine kinase
MAARREGGNPSAYELDIVAQDGHHRSVIAKGTPIQYHNSPAILMLLIDITERKRVEDALVVSEARFRDRTAELSVTNLKLEKEIGDRIKIQKKLILSTTEKDLLLREVHHRVKNNLQLIIGLVDMTKTRAHEPAVRSTLTDIMTKVQTMGSIHSRLYESKRFDKINMKRQVQDLVDMIAGFYDHDHLDITTNIDCAEIYLTVDRAIPCALALNELISNIHKHAFSGRRSGLVEISSSVKGDQIRFVVRDNGVGLPTGFNIEKSNRLGLKLMRTLVEQQLRGSVQITSIAGTEVVIEFPINREE